MLSHDVANTPGVDTSLQPRELSLLRGREIPLEHGDPIPRRVLEDHADHEDDVLEVRGRDGEQRLGRGRREVGLLDRETPVLGGVVPENQIRMCVHVH
jgi:hypothetical protein